MQATESRRNSHRMVEDVVGAGHPGEQAPMPGTRWLSGPDRLTTPSYGGTPSATCWPAYA